MYRILIFAALMVSAIAGLWLMSGSAPLAAQTTPTANRSFDSTTVAPGGQVEVTIAVANYGGFGRVADTLPGGFTYVSSSLSDAQVRNTGQEYRIHPARGKTSFTYTVTASSTAGPHSFSGRPVGFQ